MRRKFTATRYPLPAAPGFTLPELVVAITLLASGALVLVGASATAVRLVADGDRQTLAAVAARNRVELLAGADCASLRDDTASDSATGVRESWRVSTGRGSGTRLVTDSVEYADRTGHTRTIVVHRLVLC